MRDGDIPPQSIQDPQGRAQPERNRDVARTPMHWNDSRHAGFTSGIPHLPVAEGYGQINVAAQEQDPRSLLALYRRLIALRNAEPALTAGRQTHVRQRGALLVFRRELRDRRLLVVLNMSGDNQLLRFSELGAKARVLLSTSLSARSQFCDQQVHLGAYEGVILVLE